MAKAYKTLYIRTPAELHEKISAAAENGDTTITAWALKAFEQRLSSGVWSPAEHSSQLTR